MTAVALSSGDLLAGVPLFAALTADELDALEQRCCERRYDRGEYLVVSGDTSRCMYLLTRGRARVFRRDARGHELTLALLKPGECFGELALLAGTLRSADVVAVDTCRALQIPRAAVIDTLARNPGAGLAMMQRLVDQVLTLTDEVHGLALDGVYPRLRRLLLRHADNVAGQRQVRGFSHRDIALMIGASREMVTRLLADLRTGGYISAGPRQITLLGDLPEQW